MYLHRMLKYKQVYYRDNCIIDEDKAKGEKEVEERPFEEDAEVVALELCRSEVYKHRKQKEDYRGNAEEGQCATIAGHDAEDRASDV